MKESSARVVAAVVAGAAVSAALILGFAAGVAVGAPEASSALANWITAFAAIFALVVGYFTIRRHQHEATAHRQMETLHRLDAEYDAVRFDIHQLRRAVKNGGPNAPKAITEADEFYFYQRYFIALENCLRCYRLGLVPESEFVSWTCSLITRFAREGCLVHVTHPNPQMQRAFRMHWENHRDHSVGDKHVFNAYVDGIWYQADEGPWKTFAKTADFDDATRRALQDTGEQIVARIKVASS